MTTEASAPPTLSFSSELWDGFQFVSDKAKSGHRTLDKVISFMKDKSSLDQSYSKSLKKLAQGSMGSLEGTTFQMSFTQFEGLNAILSENHEIFAAKVVEQVKKPLELLKETLTKAHKTLLQQGTTLVKQHADQYSKLEKSRSRAEQACRASLAARKAAKLAADHEKERANTISDPAQLQQLAQNTAKAKKKAQELSRDAINADRQFMADVKSARNFRARYDQGMANVLQQSEQVEVNRLHGILASMKHYMAIQQQYAESVLKTVQTVSAMIDAKMNPAADLREFIVNRMTGKPMDPMPEYVQFEGHPMGPLLPDEDYMKTQKELDDDDGQNEVFRPSSSEFAADNESDETPTESSLPRSASAEHGSTRRSSESGHKAGAFAALTSFISSAFVGVAGDGSESANNTSERTKRSGSAASGTGHAPARARASTAEEDNDDEVIEFDAGSSVVAKGAGYVVIDEEVKKPVVYTEQQKATAEATVYAYVRRILGRGKSPEALERKSAPAPAPANPAPTPSTIPATESHEQDYAFVEKDSLSVRPAPAQPPASASAPPSSPQITHQQPPRSASADSLSNQVQSHASVWDNTDDATLAAEVLKLLKSPLGRDAFASVLNQQRNTNDALHLTKEGFDALGELVMQFLDEAQVAMHVRPAQLVMIMSQTFFYTPALTELAESAASDGSGPEESGVSVKGTRAHRTGTGNSSLSMPKVFLQERIKPHPIWNMKRFWEEAFFDSYNLALSKHNKIAKTQKWHSDLEQEEGLQGRKNIIFAQLGTFAHNMNEFGMDPKHTREFIEKMCTINELDKEQEEMLMQMPALQQAATPKSSHSRQSSSSAAAVNSPLPRAKTPGSLPTRARKPSATPSVEAELADSAEAEVRSPAQGPASVTVNTSEGSARPSPPPQRSPSVTSAASSSDLP